MVDEHVLRASSLSAGELDVSPVYVRGEMIDERTMRLTNFDTGSLDVSPVFIDVQFPPEARPAEAPLSVSDRDDTGFPGPTNRSLRAATGYLCAIAAIPIFLLAIGTGIVLSEIIFTWIEHHGLTVAGVLFVLGIVPFVLVVRVRMLPQRRFRIRASRPRDRNAA